MIKVITSEKLYCLSANSVVLSVRELLIIPEFSPILNVNFKKIISPRHLFKKIFYIKKLQSNRAKAVEIRQRNFCKAIKLKEWNLGNRSIIGIHNYFRVRIIIG
jgi:hypothetical protein